MREEEKMKCDRCYIEHEKLYRYPPWPAFRFCRECMKKMMQAKERTEQADRKGKTA